MLSLVYLPANSAWAFVFGANVSTAELIKLDGYPMFFASKSDARSAAERKGMVIA